MRLATFSYAGRPRIGVAVEDGVVDLTEELGAGADATLTDLLEQGADQLARVERLARSGQRVIPIDQITLGPPVRPRKFFAVGLNYADHVAEAGLALPEHLTVFLKASTSVTGPYASVERPAVSTQLDYEGELGIVIGKRCRHVKAADAAAVIAGYVVVDDVSVRDWQMMSQQWSLGKSFDTHGPIGPYLVTPDEVGDPHDLGLSTYVNGELRQSTNTSNLIFDCYDIIEIISQACTLEPGDVIATGTTSGVAAGIEGTPWLVPGDRVRVEIERVGAIDNEVVAEAVPDSFSANPGWAGPDELAASSAAGRG
jgi:2-keto-4-pentenoate hydratase/2-oxohepta-3-ene-1,7-dioic acid hydratase in catechol pathway